MTKQGKKEIVVPKNSPTWAIAYVAFGLGAIGAIAWLAYQGLATSDGIHPRDYPIAFLIALVPLAASLVTIYLIAWRKTRTQERRRTS